jgi:hypothetical protein
MDETVRIGESSVTKLTLSIEEAVVEKAKRIAEANQTSVSAMFSQFVQSAAVQPKRRAKVGPLTRKLSGIVALPRGKDYKEALTEALMDKHGLAR